MFGVDRLILSKPKDIKTVAKTFTQNIRDVVELSKNRDAVSAYKNNDNHNDYSKKEIEKQISIPNEKLDANIEINKANIKSIQNKPLPKVTIIKPVAKSFLNQVNKIEEISSVKETKNKLLFSYSDSKGRFGNLENNGSRIKLVLSKKTSKDYIEEQIDIYNLHGQIVKQNGLFVQLKGWGNLKELSIANALKKSIGKFSIASNEVIIHSYNVSSITKIADGGWECKVKVTPGKI